MRLKKQFIITMILFVIILIVMALSAIITDQQVERVSEQEKIANSIAQGASELSYLANDYLIYRESQQLKRWQSRFALFSAHVASLRGDRPDQQALVANIRANQNRLKEVFDSVASAPPGSSRNQRTTLDPAFLQVSWSRMGIQSQGLVSDASRLEQLFDQRVDQLRNRMTMLIYVMVSLFGIFFLVSYRLTYRRILKSLARLQAGAAVVGSGNLDFIIEEKKKDEIGDLAHAFNRMTADLKTITASKAELEREIAQRKQAEEARQAAHERALWLARFPDENPNPVLRASADGIVLYCNEASVKLPGWTCEVG
ncbi:MAG: HAMP domain-containing protein, partial [Thermodesulfobacteriota bacterium]